MVSMSPADCENIESELGIKLTIERNAQIVTVLSRLRWKHGLAEYDLY